MEYLANFIAGFAFFLVGLKLFSSNLNQITSKRFRILITRFTPNELMASLWGIVLSLLTAGNTILTPCITAGFETVGAINLRKAIQIVIWSRVGACFFIYLAGFDIKILVLLMMGLSGIAFAINKPKQYVTFASSVFNLCLVLFGIQLIKSSTKALVHLDWFHTIVQSTQQYPEIAFLAGFLFIMFAQSLFGALVIAISFMESGIFQLNQALFFTYGIYLGEAILKVFYLTAFKGIFKKIMALLPIIYLGVFIVGVINYFAEHFFKIPLVEFLAHSLAFNPKEELAHINLAFHLIAILILSINARYLEDLVHKIFGKRKEERKKNIVIPPEILDDPIMTLSLVSNAEKYLIKHFPSYMDYLRKEKKEADLHHYKDLHKYLKENLNEIRSVFSGLLKRSHYQPEICNQLLHYIEKQNLFISLEKNLYHFSLSIHYLRSSTKNDSSLIKKFFNFVEAMDVILLTLIDVINDPKDPFNIEVLKKITSERDDFLKDIRNQYSYQLDIEEKAELTKLINLFESNIWIAQKIAGVITEEEEENLEINSFLSTPGF